MSLVCLAGSVAAIRTSKVSEGEHVKVDVSHMSDSDWEDYYKMIKAAHFNETSMGNKHKPDRTYGIFGYSVAIIMLAAIASAVILAF